MEFYFFIFPA